MKDTVSTEVFIVGLTHREDIIPSSLINVRFRDELTETICTMFSFLPNAIMGGKWLCLPC